MTEGSRRPETHRFRSRFRPLGWLIAGGVLAALAAAAGPVRGQEDVLVPADGLPEEPAPATPPAVVEPKPPEELSLNKRPPLSGAGRLAELYASLKQVTRQEDRSLWSVSSLLAAGAARAGIQVGQVHIFDYYDDALSTIAREGLAVYARRVTSPYLAVARGHFDRERLTYTERLVQRLRRADAPAGADHG